MWEAILPVAKKPMYLFPRKIRSNVDKKSFGPKNHQLNLLNNRFDTYHPVIGNLFLNLYN